MITMRLLPLSIAMILLLSGCLSLKNQLQPETPGQNVSPQSSNTSISGTPVQSCDEYCPTLAHVACTGRWNISGTYPGCNCAYVCDAIPGANNTIPANQTNETSPGANSSSGNQPANPLDQPGSKPPENLTNVSALLDTGMASIRHDFYAARSGSFLERTYVWQAGITSIPGEIGINSPATDVKFDGKVIDSILASGFYVFIDKSDDSRYCSGLAIFRGTNTFLDTYGSQGTFSIDYFPQIIDKKLRGCSILNKDYGQDGEGWLITYNFHCSQALDK